MQPHAHFRSLLPPHPTLTTPTPPPSPSLELEYKYVIRNPDGGVSMWKPGSNFNFTLAAPAPAATPAAAPAAAPLPGGVAVRDAWDGSVRDVRLEVTEGGRSRPMTGAEAEESAFRESVRGFGFGLGRGAIEGRGSG